jgi:putative ABC transport system ATP-binding protein
MDDEQRTLFRRRHTGIIFQFFNLIDTLSVWENVTLPLELCGAQPAASERAAGEMLAAVGLLERRDSFPDRLSGGEQQRVAIARALVHDPDIVLADEPTGNLDEATGADILSLLDALTRKRGKNLMLVTHSNEAAACADRVLHLHDGSLQE